MTERLMGDPAPIRFDSVEVYLGPEDFDGRSLELTTGRRRAALNATVMRLIEGEWDQYAAEQTSRGEHGHLTVSPLFRFESYEVTRDAIAIKLSQTDYKEVYGTNIRHPEVASVFGNDFMANALGICAVVRSSDGKIAMFQRSADVLELPGYYHMCAGHFERSKENVGRLPNAIAAMSGEVCEELSLGQPALKSIRPMGLCRSLISYKPELLFGVELDVSSTSIGQSSLNFEHKKLYWLSIDEIPLFLKDSWRQMVPAGKAALAMHLVSVLGESEFRRVFPSFAYARDAVTL